MEERKTYTDEELSAVLEKHRVMLSVGTFIMYAAVVVILGGTLACAVFEIEELLNRWNTIRAGDCPQA